MPPQGPVDPTIQRVRSFKRELRRARSFRASREKMEVPRIQKPGTKELQNDADSSLCPPGTLVQTFTLTPANSVWFLKVTFLLKRSKAGRAGRLSHSHTMYNVHYNYTDTTKILTKIIISNSLIMVSLNTTKIFNLRWRVKVVKEFSKINVKKAQLRLESESSKLR